MKLYNQQDELILDVEVTDDSYSYNTIMGENSLALYFSSTEFIEVPVGAYCDFFGTRFTLKKESNFTKNGSRNFAYTLTLETNQEDLKNWKIRNPADNRIKFSLTATPREHLQLLVDNLNMRSSGWEIDKCVEGSELTFEYNHTYIFDGLNDLANELDTEWQISGKKVSLCKVEYNKEDPLPLSYGKGNGFKTGVGRESGDLPVEILLVQGTDKNIDYSKYGSLELLLPKKQTIEYEGRRYITSEDGLSLQRADKELTTAKEDSLDLSEIYPSRVGEVSAVKVEDEDENFYDIVDSSIPSTLDFNDYLIDGETMTIIFQTGMLAGREFEVKYIHKAKSVYGVQKEARRFEIVPAENDGITMPGGVYVPAVGDKYAVFGIQLPDDYICNNTTKTGASWDMLREAVKYLYEHEDKEFTFSGTLDSIWAKRRWNDIGNKIVVGGYILFSDPQFMPDGSKIRITGVKRYVNNPYKPEIELSNTTVGGSITSELNKASRNEVTIEESQREAIAYTKRRFRDAKETMEMLENSMLNFSGSVNPIAVQTMQLLVGDESLQFRFVNSMTNPTAVNHSITYDANSRVLTVPSGIIQHMTLGITNITSSHKASDYKYWQLSSYVSPALNDPDVSYYLYAKVSKTGTSGSFVLRDTAITMNQVEGYYHLLVGILNSEYDGERSFVTLYGFSEVLPGRMTTDKIVSSDGETYIDLLNGVICGKMKFLSGSDNLSSLPGYEDLSNGINNAKDAADNAQNAADTANASVKDLNDYVDDSFRDGIITETEAQAIATYINTVNNTKASVEASYAQIYSNAYLGSVAKSTLEKAYNSLISAITKLINSIETAIKDGYATEAESNDVDAKFDAFNSAYSTYSSAVENAVNSITSTINAKAEGAQSTADQAVKDAAAAQAAADTALNDAATANGSVSDLNDYVDGAFQDNLITQAEAKAIATYINTVNGTKSAVKASYEKLYKNELLSGDAKTGLKSAYDTLVSSISSLISSINTAISDGKTTDKEKTDVNSKFDAYNTAYAAYEEAVRVATNSIIAAVDDKVDNAQSTADQAVADAKSAQSTADDALSSANNAIANTSDLKTYVDGSFKDGVITAAEAQAIATYINSVNSASEAVKASYNKLSSNGYLSSSGKSSLKSAYDSLSTAITDLISAINDAIKDGVTTTAEKEDVDKKFSSFNSEYASYNSAVEAAYSDIYGNIIISADDSAKEEVARLGETIIDGGYIRTELIKAIELIVRHLVVESSSSSDKRKVEISPDNMGVDIYDTDGNLCTSLEGNSYSSANELFGGSSGTVEILSRSSTVYGYGSNTTMGKGTISKLYGTSGMIMSSKDEDIELSSSWYTDQPVEVAASGTLYCHAYSVKVSTTSGGTGAEALAIPSSANALLKLLLITYSDSGCTNVIETKDIATCSAYSCGDDMTNATYDNKTSKVSVSGSKTLAKAGYHKIVLRVSLNAIRSTKNYAEASWGSAVSSGSNLSVTYQSEFYVSRFFANGFALGRKSDNYVMVTQDSSKKMKFDYKCGDYGVTCSSDGIKVDCGKHSLVCSSSGIQVKHHNGNLMNMPQLVFSGRAYYKQDSDKNDIYDWDEKTSFDGNYPDLSRVSKGTIKLTFPSAWTSSTKLGTLSSSNLIVNVVGYGYIQEGSSYPNKANLLSLSKTDLTVTISDDESPNDGSFFINIWII